MQNNIAIKFNQPEKCTNNHSLNMSTKSYKIFNQVHFALKHHLQQYPSKMHNARRGKLEKKRQGN